MGIVKELRTKNENLEMKTERLKRQLKQRNNDNRILAVKLEAAMQMIALLVQKSGGRVEMGTEEMLEAEKLCVWSRDDEANSGKKILETRGGSKQNG